MKTLKQLLITGLIAIAGVIAVPTFALAASDEPAQHGYVHGADYSMFQMDRYHEDIAHMSPEDRSKLMAMQDKLMQMEMDHASSQMKMDMEMAKAKRDMQMFIYSVRRTAERGQAGS
jgi:hypothetical protein